MFKTVSGVLISTAAIIAAPAHAGYLFGDSQYVNNAATLTLDEKYRFVAIDQGWIKEDGQHITNNSNYIVGSADSSKFNNYFSFKIGDNSSLGQYKSATLTIANTNNSGGPFPFTYTLFDVAASSEQLDVYRGAGDATGAALFADLGSGTTYGGTTISSRPGDFGTFTTIQLNQAFLDRVNAGLLSNFAIGGTLSPAAVPEPATWAMMLVGFGMIGATARYRRRKTAAAYA